MKSFDVIVIGAGAAGLQCAAAAGARGRRVLLLDNAKKAGRKILISGGGRCNFTNYYIEPGAYLSRNKHFCKSALTRYTQWDFIGLVDKHKIPYHEKTLGQLFCDDSAKEIVDMLLKEADEAGVTVQLRTEILGIEKLDDNHYQLATSEGDYQCQSLVIATGGLSMPKLGATPFGYQVARQFGLNILDTRAGLVPLTLHAEDKENYECLSGISAPVEITAEDGTVFKESLLFTHRGVSGPAVLQISSYWHPGQMLSVNLLPGEDLADILHKIAAKHPNQALKHGPLPPVAQALYRAAV